MATVESYKTKKGLRYRVRYRKPDGNSTDKRGFTTKDAAREFASEIDVSLRRGDYIDPNAGKVTIGDLGPDWLKRQRAHMKPSAFRSLDSAWKVHVEPKWGSTALYKVKFTNVQEWVAEIGDRRSATIVLTAYGVLARILDDAVRDRLIRDNPARGVKLPRKVPKRNVYLTHLQVRSLATEAGRYFSLILLLSYTGLRWGEAAGLRVKDLDLLRKRATIYENAVKVGGAMVVGTLKGHKHRTVPLPDFLVVELARTCEGKDHDDLLWPSASGKHMGPPSSHDSWLSGAVARCQKGAAAAREAEGKNPTTPPFPRVTAHDLRHTAASLAISAGANVKAVQKMLGHKSAAMTLDVYADLFDDDLNAVAAKLDSVVGKLWAETA